jgi:hypothetical protein
MSAKTSLFVLACLLAISVYGSVSANEAQHSDLPPPPPKPEKFTTKQQLKDYLVKLHEYYAIIGRPRFGRSFPMSMSAETSSVEFDNELTTSNVPVSMILEIMDRNNDGFISKKELNDFLRVFQKQ